MRLLWLLCVALLLTGCPTGDGSTITIPPDVPPSTIPDGATVALLSGTWEGISTTSTGVQDYLTFEFYPSGDYLRVRVSLNHSLLATPYANVTADDRIGVDAADLQGNSGLFDATLDRIALRIDGTFATSNGSFDDTGDFYLEKQL
ncbi:MAG: hypothetical protein ABI743_08300 [bacterium]